MRAFSIAGVLAGLVLVAGLGCTEVKPKPLKPPKPVPAGTVLFQFLRSVKGPLDLTIDGTRVQVEPSTKKYPKYLTIKGLAEGKHTYFLSSPRDAFGPDQGEFEIKGDKGTFIICFSQKINSMLYGKPEALPPAAGLPGVTAKMD